MGVQKSGTEKLSNSMPIWHTDNAYIWRLSLPKMFTGLLHTGSALCINFNRVIGFGGRNLILKSNITIYTVFILNIICNALHSY